jgi:hypothetical protein
VIPEERISAEDALRHCYVAKFHNSGTEKRLKAAVVPPLSDDVQVTNTNFDWIASIHKSCLSSVMAKSKTDFF